MQENTSLTGLNKVYEEVIAGWVRALSLRDYETAGHSERVAQMAVFLATELGVPEKEISTIRRGALLHDIGKIGLPDAILLKPDTLTDEEALIVRQHIQYAGQLLEPMEFLKPAREMILNQSEQWDGRGYPNGLQGEAIPLPARILAVAGVWDALRSERPYRPAFREEEAIQLMRDQSGKMFDPHVLEVFLKILSSSKPQS